LERAPHALDHRQAHDQAVGRTNQRPDVGAMGLRREGPAAMAEAVGVSGLAAARSYSNLFFQSPPSPLFLAARREPGQSNRALLHPGAGAFLEDAAVRPDMRDGQRVTDGLEAGKREREPGGGAQEANSQTHLRTRIDAGARRRAVQRLTQGAELRIDKAFQRRILMRALPPVCTTAVHPLNVGSGCAHSRGGQAEQCDLMGDRELLQTAGADGCAPSPHQAAQSQREYSITGRSRINPS